jgi:LemA protein
MRARDPLHAPGMSILLAIACAALAVWAVLLYNLLVRDRVRVAAAWSDVEVQLKRRHDLIPKLVEAVKQHAGYERGVLERVAALRSNALAARLPGERAGPEGALGEGAHRLVALAEQYPALKASQSFLDLQRNLSEVEDQIQYARRYYNGAVNNLNTRVDSFPDLLVARLFGYRRAEYFELAGASEGVPPEVR